MKSFLIAAVALLAVGCGEASTPISDAGTLTDAGTATRDAGTVPTLHGCSSTSFVDKSASSADRSITFGGSAGLKYSPNCMIITAGEKVTFEGDFSSHPLVAGEYQGSGGTTPNPIPSTSTGSANTEVTFPTAGLYPYYCNFHAGVGMTGVIWVQ